MPRFLCAVIASLASAAFAGGPPTPTLYGVDRDGILFTIDPLTATTLTSVPVTLEGYEVNHCNGLARHPATGALYAVVRAALLADGTLSDLLATLDPETGAGTVIGDLGDMFAGLAFLPDGTLLGVTGDGANVESSLFRINPATAAATLISTLGNGDDGEAIATTPDGAVYHASGAGSEDEHFERLNFAGLVGITDILTGHSHGVGDEGILSLGLSGSTGTMFGTDYAAQNLFTIDLGTGERTTIGFIPARIKGLAIDGSTFFALENASPPNLLTLDPATADILTTTEISLAGHDLSAATGMARQPGTGTLFAILVNNHDGKRLLATVNPGDGAATLIGPLSDKFAGLAFRSDGALLGVTGFGARVPKSLYVLNTSTAAATFLRSLPNGIGGEQAIAIGPNATLYHAAGYRDGAQYFESMDPFVAAPPFFDDIPHPSVRTFIFDSPGGVEQEAVLALGWSQALNKMFVAPNFNAIFTTGTSSPATFTFIGGVPDRIKGIAFDGATCYTVSADDVTLRTINTTTGATLTSLPVGLPGATILTLNGLARNPADGKLFLITGDDNFGGGGNARHLCTVDPATGAATLIGLLQDNFAGLAFRANGTLIGVTGTGAADPANLYILDTTDASATYLMHLPNGGSGGQAIAIAPDGFLYHAAGYDPDDQRYERINLDTQAIDPIDTPALTHSFPYAEAAALAFSSTLASMYYTDRDGELWTIDIHTGETQLVGNLQPADGGNDLVMKGLAFADDIVIPCPGDANGDGHVDFIDLNIVLSDYGHTGALQGDLDHDGDCDFVDLNIVLSAYGTSC